MTKIGAGQFIVDFLLNAGVPYAVGIPGHGILTMVDALIDRTPELKTIMVRHEQAAAHLADGYARITGQPIAIFTSVGPGAVNTLVGLATAMADSIPIIAITGNCQSYFVDRGAIQDISHHHASDFTSMVRPVVKRSWSVTRAGDLPDVLQRALRLATSGRPGPVHIEVPMDVQAAEIEAPAAGPDAYRVPWRLYPDPESIRNAAGVILAAQRPVLLVGGGVILADAAAELREVAEYLGIPVITTTQSKGVIPEDHPLNAYYTGPKGSTCGVKVTRSADVLIAVGFRFAEWASGSYRHGETFFVPPARIVQIDIDPAEIGRNYPVAAAVLADARTALTALLSEIRSRARRRSYESSAAYRELQAWRAEWQGLVAREANKGIPMNLSRALAELRRALPNDAIICTSSGHTQGLVYQEFPVYAPRTHLSAGGFSTMGWSVPASLGAKLAAPGQVVAAIIGEGDFLMTCQELATAVQYDIPILCCVMNNAGYLSIRDMQASIFGPDRVLVTESRLRSGDWYTPELATLATAFGAYGARVEDPRELSGAVRDALSSGRPAVLDIQVARTYPDSGNRLGQWAEFPKPTSATPAAP